MDTDDPGSPWDFSELVDTKEEKFIFDKKYPEVCYEVNFFAQTILGHVYHVCRVTFSRTRITGLASPSLRSRRCMIGVVERSKNW